MDIKHTIELIGSAFELAGVAVLVIGSVLAFARYIVSLIRLRDGPVAYRRLRLNLGRSIVLGLELLVAADIINSVAINPTFASVGVLGLIVLVRTFLSWSLEVEINGEWPWQRLRFHKGEPGDDEKQQSENAAGADQTQNVGHVQAQPDDQQDENRQARRFVHHGLKRGGSFWRLCSDEQRDAQRDEHQQDQRLRNRPRI